MQKVSIRFHSKTAQLLREKATKKAITSSEYIRRLVELGLGVEEYSASKNDEKNQPAHHEMIKDALTSALHTNLLVKNIFLIACNKSAVEKEKFIQDTAEKARKFVIENYPEATQRAS